MVTGDGGKKKVVPVWPVLARVCDNEAPDTNRLAGLDCGQRAMGDHNSFPVSQPHRALRLGVTFLAVSGSGFGGVFSLTTSISHVGQLDSQPSTHSASCMALIIRPLAHSALAQSHHNQTCTDASIRAISSPVVSSYSSSAFDLCARVHTPATTTLSRRSSVISLLDPSLLYPCRTRLRQPSRRLSSHQLSVRPRIPSSPLHPF